ncbi:MAG TPA: hypothetical protein VI141_04000, partial [Acidimicrobiia bacterium]
AIDDAVEAKSVSGTTAREVEREVLTELGDPDRLASGYVGRPAFLIGPEHFFAYKRLLTVLLVTVVPIVAVVIAVVQAISGADIGSVLGQTFGLVINLVVHIVFWTTLVFALIERSDEKTVEMDWTLDQLPSMPVAGSIRFGETVATVVVLVLAMAALLVSRTVSPVATAAGDPIPFFDPDLWSFWFPFLLAVLALEIVFEVVKYRVGHWTWALASVNLALNVLFAVPAIYLLTSEQLFNPEFFAEIGWQEPEAGGSIVVITVVSIIGVVVWDVIDGFRKARR